MSTKHTPGPWTNTNAHMYSHYIHAPGHRQMYFLGWSSDMPDDEQEANARLIAAAPELLEALEDMVRIIGPPESAQWANEDEINAAWNSSVAAIAKAKGEDA